MSPARRPSGHTQGEPAELRVAVYTDYAYHRVGGEIFAERAFALFLARLSTEVRRLVLLGRLDPEPVRSHYPLGAEIDFRALPHYPSLADPVAAIRGMAGSLRHMWRALDDVDCVWLLGPHPIAPLFAAMARARGRRVVLGVRQDFPSYVAGHRPGRHLIQVLARVLEGSYRLLARRFAVVVVGPELARNYRAAPALLEIAVSLIGPEDIVAGEAAGRRSYDGELTILSVGRLDAEKNPMMMADVLALLRERDPRWRLVVCGEGPMAAELAERLARLGVAEHAELRGYVALDDGLMDVYRGSHALLHTSWTEGLPQVLFEAFAAGLPVVASDVGGIGDAVGGAVRLVTPGDAAAAAAELRRIAAEPDLRAGLIAGGERLARSHTIGAETRRVAGFLAAGGG
jgi:glycosyltransferase involved in cell wall biosynthesis